MADNTGVAPICNAKPAPPDFSTKAPSMPRFSIPDFNNPRSLAKAIHQLQQAVNAITNGTAAPNNTTPGSPASGAGGGAAGGGGGKQKPQEPDEWAEKSRVTQNVKVVNPDDDSQFVVVKEIVQIIFERPISGEQIIIKRDPR